MTEARVAPLSLPGAAPIEDQVSATRLSSLTASFLSHPLRDSVGSRSNAPLVEDVNVNASNPKTTYERLLHSTVSSIALPSAPERSECTSSIRDALRTATLQQQSVRSAVIERDLPLSLVRVLFSTLSLLLVLSDVLRSGLGIRILSVGLPHAGISYQRIQPSTFMFSGPGNNSYVSFDRTSAPEQSVRVWLYKFDAMSLVWRAFAMQYPSIGDNFPPCLLDYSLSCADGGADEHDATFSGDVVFNLIDAISNELAESKPSPRFPEPTTAYLRTRSIFRDRAHHLLLPGLFSDEVWRIHQGLYYSPDTLAYHMDPSRRLGSLCYNRGARPNFCNELYINYMRSCKSGVAKCTGVGLLHMDILKSVDVVQQANPGSVVDLTILDSQDDVQETMGGISTVGFRRSEVTSIVRARNCSVDLSECETVFIQEHRFASARVASDSDEWFMVVATMRSIGQAYMFLRVTLLIGGCFVWVKTIAKSASTNIRPFRYIIRDTCGLLGKVPVHCVVYGSPFPIFCYAFAHFVDSPATYLLLNGSFLSSGGLQNVTIGQFVPLAVMQMRNVWLFALLLQAVVAIHSSDRFGWRRCQHKPPLPSAAQLYFTPTVGGNNDKHRPFDLRGVLGVPEYALSALSCVTVAAQYRLPSFRYTAITDVYELANPRDYSNQRLMAVKYQHASILGKRGAGARQLGGVIIDLKFLVTALIVALSIYAAANLAVLVVNHALEARYHGSEKHQMQGKDQLSRLAPWRLGSRTPVPYSAGVLWPKTALSVHWTSDFFCIEQIPRAAVSPLRATPREGIKRTASNLASFSKQLLRFQNSVITVPTAIPPSSSTSTLRRIERSQFTPASPVMSALTFDRLQRRLERLDDRDDRVGANIAFMNLVVMSDPIVLAVVRRLARIRLGYYAVNTHQGLLLLPETAAANVSDDSELKLLAKVDARDLSWCELLQCG